MHYMAVTGFEKMVYMRSSDGQGASLVRKNQLEMKEEIEALIKAEGDFWEMVKTR